MLFEAAADGDEVATSVVDEVVETFARAVAPVVLASGTIRRTPVPSSAAD